MQWLAFFRSSLLSWKIHITVLPFIFAQDFKYEESKLETEKGKISWKNDKNVHIMLRLKFASFRYLLQHFMYLSTLFKTFICFLNSIDSAFGINFSVLRTF